MEILKKTILFLAIFGLQMPNAQGQKNIQDAFSKSYAFEYNKKYQEAIDVIKSLNANDNYPTQLRLAWLQYSAKKYEESVESYKKAADIMPASIEPLLGMVNPLSALKKWTNLEQVYLDILRIDSKNSAVNYKLGLIYYNRKEYSKASNYFSTSLNLYPFDYDSMLMSAWSYYFLGKYSEAKELFNRVLLYSPTDVSAKEGLELIK